MQYLTDLECPFGLKAASVASDEIVDWLLHYAVDLAYTDNGKLCDGPLLLDQITLKLHQETTASKYIEIGPGRDWNGIELLQEPWLS